MTSRWAKVRAMLDRVKAAWVALARGAHHTIDYQTFYRAKVLRQGSSLKRLDLAPTDPRLPEQMANVPLKVGVPGLDVTVSPGHFVLIGWENGRPDRPYATLWDPGSLGTIPIKLTLNATIIELGGSGLLPPKDGVVRAETPCQFTGAPHFVGGLTSLGVMAKATP